MDVGLFRTRIGLFFEILFFVFVFQNLDILMENIADISRNVCHQDDVLGYNAPLLSCENPNF